MKLNLIVNGTEDQMEILAPAPGCRFVLGGAEHSANVQVAEPNVYSVVMDGRSYDARVEELPGGLLVVVIDGFRFEVDVRDPRRFSRKAGGLAGAGVQTIAAPMPGKVVRVLVKVGDVVEPGQGLVVVEAMKMQNEMKAARAGTVLTLSAQEGSTVSAGDVLATIG